MIDYEKAWLELKDILSQTENSGNMLKQTIANSLLEIMNDIEKNKNIGDKYDTRQRRHDRL